MKAVLQRVRCASVEIENQRVGEIDQGLVVLLGIAQGDELSHARTLAEKIQTLRIFSDDAGKMNRSIKDIQGSVLVVSQFTLLANTNRGRRPSFEKAASPEQAMNLYKSFMEHLRHIGLHVEAGTFGATMVISLENDGPVTLVLDTNKEESTVRA